MKAKELSGENGILFRCDSQSDALRAIDLLCESTVHEGLLWALV